MKYAVIVSGGKQYAVHEGDIFDVDRVDAKVNDQVTFPQVLLYVFEGTRTIGSPHVSGVVVSATVLEQKKGEKIRVAEFKAKARYRRVRGFRALLTKVRIEKIGAEETTKEITQKKQQKATKKNATDK